MSPRHPKLPKVAPVLLAGALACAGTAAWALWPLPACTIPSAEDVLAMAEQPTPSAAPAQAGHTFNPAAFHAPIWVVAAPEPEPALPPPPAPPPALRATLLAIARDASHAIVHDQDADAIVTLRMGDAFQGRTVERIEPSRVSLALGSGQVQTLELGYSVGPPARHAAALPEGSP